MGQSPYHKIRRDIVLEYLENYKECPSRMIARIMFRNKPEFFKDVEAARKMVRIYRGQAGNRSRKLTRLTKYYTYEV